MSVFHSPKVKRDFDHALHCNHRLILENMRAKKKEKKTFDLSENVLERKARLKGVIKTFKLNFYINHRELLFMGEKKNAIQKKFSSNTVGAERNPFEINVCCSGLNSDLFCIKYVYVRRNKYFLCFFTVSTASMSL